MSETLRLRIPSDIRFGFQDDRAAELERLCASAACSVRFSELGVSEEGRSIFSVDIGEGPLHASLIAGSHADEPVGPETLTLLIKALVQKPEAYKRLFSEWTLSMVPHVNPDGENRNRLWMDRWPDPGAYIENVVRELPGRDIEFGYPAMRVENDVVSKYLAGQAPIHLHMSLHGMGFGEGILLLIERQWRKKAGTLMDSFVDKVLSMALSLHDHDRQGDKGFEYLGPGFSTTPRGTAMRAYFLEKGETDTASLFDQSSMEFVRSLGGDPLSLVTEVPLFLITDGPAYSTPGHPARYLALRDRILQLNRQAGIAGDDIRSLVHEFGIRSLPLSTQISLQLEALSLGIETVRAHSLA